MLIVIGAAIAVPAASASPKAQLAKGGAFQYGVSTFLTVLRPIGFAWDPEGDAEPTGRGETVAGEQLDVRCRVERNAAFGTCTIDYLLTKDTGVPALISCAQRVRARNLAPHGALRTAKRHGEFIPRETRVHGGNAYSYHGYAIACAVQDPERTEIVYPGDK